MIRVIVASMVTFFILGCFDNRDGQARSFLLTSEEVPGWKESTVSSSDSGSSLIGENPIKSCRASGSAKRTFESTSVERPSIRQYVSILKKPSAEECLRNVYEPLSRGDTRVKSSSSCKADQFNIRRITPQKDVIHVSYHIFLYTEDVFVQLRFAAPSDDLQVVESFIQAACRRLESGAKD